MRFALRQLALAAMLTASLPPSIAAEAPRYGAMLEGFEYPHAVKRYELRSQGQTLSMAYMDVPPEKAVSPERVAVLLHGKNFCAATWERTIETLSRAGWRVIAPDQIGFCKSSKPQGYQFSLAQLAANMQALLASLGVPRATVIGHSMGGMLATRYTLMFPQQVERLVLVNPIGLEDWQAEGVPYASIDALYQNELRTSADSIRAYQLRYYYPGGWKPEYERWVTMQAGLYAGEGRERVAWNQAQTSEMIFTQPIAHEFADITRPTTLMIGGRDRTAPGANRATPEVAQRLGQYETLGRRTAAAIPGAQLIEFPELGHSPQVEAPERFHERLLEALR